MKEDKLWTSGQLGAHSPQALLRTVWCHNNLLFGWRGRDEHHCACYGDFCNLKDEEGCEYMEWQVERGSKTRTGVEGQMERAYNPLMYAAGPERCQGYFTQPSCPAIGSQKPRQLYHSFGGQQKTMSVIINDTSKIQQTLYSCSTEYLSQWQAAAYFQDVIQLISKSMVFLILQHHALLLLLRDVAQLLLTAVIKRD